MYSSEDLPALKLDRKRFRVKQCPCGKSNADGKFVPYIGYDDKGYCHSCAETFLPLRLNQEPDKYPSNYSRIMKSISYIPDELFKASLKGYEQNHFISYLINLFGSEITNNLINTYHIGSSKHWKGATVFWQRDLSGKIRTGKIMLYNALNGKRIKTPFTHITWAHIILQLKDFELKQCFFGEHLLTDRSKTVAIVESEKTALIASVYLPQFIWLAVGSISNLTIQKFAVLKARKVVLFPDLNGYTQWNNKIIALSSIADVYISDLLERKATEKDRILGLDLADYLINYNSRGFTV